MGISDTQLKRVTDQAKSREAQGYFERARGGDMKASSLFARLIAFDLNPTGKASDFGWLSKLAGSNVDGWADDAVCGNADQSDLENVVDLVNGAGAPNASVGGGVKPRRPADKWAAPKPLTGAEMAYLLDGADPKPVLGGGGSAPTYPYPDEPTKVLAYEKRVESAYHSVHRKFPDEADPDAFRHFARYGYSCSKMPEADAANKHIAELRGELGAPPE